MRRSGAEWSVCCLSPLPMVQNTRQPHGNYVNAMTPLFDAMEEFTEQQRNVIKSRFLPMIDATERAAKRSEWWDTRMFLIGFGTSLVVTIVAAINISSFIDTMTRNVLGAVVLALSSIGTAALGLRERLKFHETALIAKRLSAKLQRRGFLFLAKADPYNAPDREECYANFIGYTEKIKLQADEEQMKLQAEREDHYRPAHQHSGAGIAGALASGLSGLAGTPLLPPPASASREISFLNNKGTRGGRPVPSLTLRPVVEVDLDDSDGPPPTPFQSTNSERV